jgi:hypothetical protein
LVGIGSGCGWLVDWVMDREEGVSFLLIMTMKETEEMGSWSKKPGVWKRWRLVYTVRDSSWRRVST